MWPQLCGQVAAFAQPGIQCLINPCVRDFVWCTLSYGRFSLCYVTLCTVHHPPGKCHVAFTKTMEITDTTTAGLKPTVAHVFIRGIRVTDFAKSAAGTMKNREPAYALSTAPHPYVCSPCLLILYPIVYTRDSVRRWGTWLTVYPGSVILIVLRVRLVMSDYHVVLSHPHCFCTRFGTIRVRDFAYGTLRLPVSHCVYFW